MRRRGCGYLGGLMLGLLAVLGVLLLWGKRAFSPGPLSAQRVHGTPLGGVTSHADLETQCGACHRPFQSHAALCLQCHTAIAQEMQSQGLHARFPEPQQCRTCHPEHRGRNADLLEPALGRFNHDLTRFSLRKHVLRYDLTAMTCQDCHTAFPDMDRAALLQACRGCHTQANPDFMQRHVQAFHVRCLECHDGLDSMAQFDHSTTRFPLEGRHQEIRCEVCHAGAVFKGLPSQCHDCHKEPDVHRGLFTDPCYTCHNPNGWTPALWQGRPFDHHAQTGFSLKHHRKDPDTGQAITCRACHAGPDFASFQTETCIACHQKRDADFINRHIRQYGRACLQCHDGVDRMRGFDHAQVFPLRGAHAQLACQACHINFRFQGIPNQCSGCHEEPDLHRGLFGLKCMYCHTEEAWHPAQLRLHLFFEPRRFQ